MSDRIEISQDVIEAATDWLLKIDEDPCVRVSEPFERWLHASPAHVEAFVRVSKCWETTAPENLGLAGALLATQRRISSFRTGLAAFRLREVSYALAGVAALVAAVVMVPALIPEAVTPVYYHAGKGEVRTIELADKSTLYVDTDTSATVRHTSSNRIVELDHGRVFVAVNGKDPRVFKVVSGQTAFTATGTAYSVITLKAGYQLDVYEGTVEVRRDDRLLGAVHAGEGARVAGSRMDRFMIPGAVGEGQPDWTRNRITFTATPLGDAVAAFNRYSAKEIVLTDMALQARPVTGVFALNDVDAFLRSVEVVMDASVRETETRVIIER